MEFFYHYDSATHKVKVTTTNNGITEEHYVDSLIVSVPTRTKLQPESPKCAVHGVCLQGILSEETTSDKKEISVLYLTNIP
jgi:hypothetical protein